MIHYIFQLLGDNTLPGICPWIQLGDFVPQNPWVGRLLQKFLDAPPVSPLHCKILGMRYAYVPIQCVIDSALFPSRLETFALFSN